MANYNDQSGPFWDFVRSMNNDNNQADEGVDHAQENFDGSARQQGPYPGMQGPWGFGPQGPYGGFEAFAGPHGPWARFGGCGRGRAHHGRGHWGRHAHFEQPGENAPQSAGAQPQGNPDEAEQGEPSTDGPEGRQRGPPPYDGQRRGRGGWGRRWGHRGAPQFGGPGAVPFDFSGLIDALSAHPLAQAFRTYAEQSGLAGNDTRSAETAGQDSTDENSFVPPIDIFSTPTSYILHVALPGAKKEDVGVNWDVEKGELNVAGVVYRLGDEEFLKSLTKTERKVGVFERSVKLPLNDEKDEIDGDGITAKLEDGVLVITVAKVEKEWTEVKKVDIE